MNHNIRASSKKSLIENLPDIYKIQIQNLSNEALELISQNREKAMEYARKGIMQVEQEKLNEEHVALIADGMQILARLVLKEREVSRKS